jgi:hypothetical protein
MQRARKPIEAKRWHRVSAGGASAQAHRVRAAARGRALRVRCAASAKRCVSAVRATQPCAKKRGLCAPQLTTRSTRTRCSSRAAGAATAAATERHVRRWRRAPATRRRASQIVSNVGRARAKSRRTRRRRRHAWLPPRRPHACATRFQAPSEGASGASGCVRVRARSERHDSHAPVHTTQRATTLGRGCACRRRRRGGAAGSRRRRASGSAAAAAKLRSGGRALLKRHALGVAAPPRLATARQCSATQVRRAAPGAAASQRSHDACVQLAPAAVRVVSSALAVALDYRSPEVPRSAHLVDFWIVATESVTTESCA